MGTAHPSRPSPLGPAHIQSLFYFISLFHFKLRCFNLDGRDVQMVEISSRVWSMGVFRPDGCQLKVIGLPWCSAIVYKVPMKFGRCVWLVIAVSR